MKLLLPTSTPLAPTVPDGVVVVPYDQREPVPAEHLDAEVLVVWGSSSAMLRDAATRLTRLRWVQTLAAGPDQVVEAGFGSDVVITSGRGLHDLPVAEHTLALVLAAARRLHVLARAQAEHRWARELGGMQTVSTEGTFRTLRGAHVVVWGFGSIAQTLTPLLTALGARVTGVARTPGTRSGVPVTTADRLTEVLPGTDLLVMILPATDATRHALDAALLRSLPRHAWVVNVGRGSTVDESALLDALRAGRLGGAALDVTEVEPLPADSPLWAEPDVILTPHAAGGRPLGADALIAENLLALVEGRPLRNLVER